VAHDDVDLDVGGRRTFGRDFTAKAPNRLFVAELRAPRGGCERAEMKGLRWRSVAAER
jgi:hypothetical protein